VGVGPGCSEGPPASEKLKDKQRNRFRSCVERNGGAHEAIAACYEGTATSLIDEVTLFSHRASRPEAPL
jgi:hypothetical protein